MRPLLGTEFDISVPLRAKSRLHTPRIDALHKAHPAAFLQPPAHASGQRGPTATVTAGVNIVNGITIVLNMFGCSG